MLQTVALHLQRLFRPPDRLKLAAQRTLSAERVAPRCSMIGGAGRDGQGALGAGDAGPRSCREHMMKMHEANSDQPGNAGRSSNVATLRARVRQDVVRGAVTRGHGADRHTVLRLLNEALATELVCTLRYRHHYFMASRLQADSVRQQFLAHARQELEHADRIAARIVQLNGEPDFNPRGLTKRSHAEYLAGDSLESMIREDLVAERIAIDSCRRIIRYLAARDPATRRLMEEILAREEEQAEDLARLLQGMSSAARGARS